MDFLIKSFISSSILKCCQEDPTLQIVVSMRRGTNKIHQNGDIIVKIKPPSSKLQSSIVDENILVSKSKVVDILTAISYVLKVNYIEWGTFTLFLKKTLIISSTLSYTFDPKTWLCNKFKESHKNLGIVVLLNQTDVSTVTEMRCNFVEKHMAKLFEMAGLNISVSTLAENCEVGSISRSDLVQEGELANQVELRYSVTSKYQSIYSSNTIILCSPVIEQRIGSKVSKSSQEYLEVLEKELSQASEHKYGDVSSSDWKDFIKFQAQNCFILQFMLVSHLIPIKVSCRDGAQNSRVAIFILYNYARICVLMKSFEAMIDAKIIPCLPPSKDVDFFLLSHQEEWELLWLYVHRFPELLHEIVEEFLIQGTRAASDSDLVDKSHLQNSLLSNDFEQKRGHMECWKKSNTFTFRHFPTYKIAQFLQNLSHCLSVYYNRVHILPAVPSSDNCHAPKVATHLLPVLWARIYLLKAVQTVMKLCFNTLNITPPTKL